MTLIREAFRTGAAGGLGVIPFALLFRSLGLRVNEYGRKPVEFVVGEVDWVELNLFPLLTTDAGLLKNQLQEANAEIAAMRVRDGQDDGAARQELVLTPRERPFKAQSP